MAKNKNVVAITEAKENFSKVCKMVDEFGNVVILYNNKPQYIINIKIK